MNVHLFLVQKINQVKKINRGGWTGFGTATVGIDPNTFEVLNGHPNKIPTDKILGGVVQNCRNVPIKLAIFPWKNVGAIPIFDILVLQVPIKFLRLRYESGSHITVNLNMFSSLPGYIYSEIHGFPDWRRS